MSVGKRAVTIVIFLVMTVCVGFMPIHGSKVKAADTVSIMLDAGHYGKQNRSPVYKKYYESDMSWKLQNYLKEELLTYDHVAVGTTRDSKNTYMSVYSRGASSNNYDLFLSLHSNYTNNRSTDYPLVVTQLNKSNQTLAKKLGVSIRNTMRTRQSSRLMTRRSRHGEYYGVLRGAKAVGTSGFILEHSFHSNLTMTKWLYSNTNLKALAAKEAAAIASYYGLKKTDAAAVSQTVVNIASSTYNSVTLRWAAATNAAGYKIYRSVDKNGPYRLIAKVPANVYTKKLSGLSIGETYYFKVKATGGEDSNIVSKKMKLSTPSISSKAGKRKITVRWGKVSGASGYELYRSTKKGSGYQLIKELSSSKRSYTNKKLKKKKKYYYKVVAYQTRAGVKYYSSKSGYTYKKAK